MFWMISIICSVFLMVNTIGCANDAVWRSIYDGQLCDLSEPYDFGNLGELDREGLQQFKWIYRAWRKGEYQEITQHFVEYDEFLRDHFNDNVPYENYGDADPEIP